MFAPRDATRASRPLAVIYFAVVARIQSETSFNAAGLNVSSILLYSVGDPVWHVWNRLIQTGQFDGFDRVIPSASKAARMAGRLSFATLAGPLAVDGQDRAFHQAECRVRIVGENVASPG